MQTNGLIMIPKVDRLVTQKCVLRTIKRSDIPYWCKWFNDEQILLYSVHRSRGYTDKQQAEIYENLVHDPTKVQFMICEPEQHKRIGITSFVFTKIDKLADISIIIGERDYWGVGIATKAIGELVKYGVQHHQIKIFTAGCDVRNVGSQRAFEKNGFFVSEKLSKSIKYLDENRLHDEIRFKKIV